MYRIKIQELRNGQIRYIPQKGTLTLDLGWRIKQVIEWKDLTLGEDTESEALRVIQDNKVLDEEAKAYEVVNTTFKTFDLD